MSVSVRYWRGAWVVDISTKENGMRKRLIESFGPGMKAKVAAELYRDDIAPQVKVGKFWRDRPPPSRICGRNLKVTNSSVRCQGRPRLLTTNRLRQITCSHGLATAR
jgi:hypothetical protein